MKFQAKQDLKIVSANAHVDFAAAKKIHLAVKGGASITIDGGITVQCPGTITVHASQKKFSGPTSLRHEFKQFPSTDYDEGFIVTDALTGKPIPNFGYRIATEGGQVIRGKTDANGATQVVSASALEQLRIDPDPVPLERPVIPKV
jgi:uncharacterized protein (DUF2345 family)